MIRNRTVGIIVGNISLAAGTERAVTNLANGLSNKRKVVLISVYSSAGDNPGYPLNDNITVVHLGMGFKKGYFSRILLYHDLYREILRIIDAYKVGYLLGTTHAYNIIISKIRHNVRTIGCEHINYNACPKPFRALRKIAYKNLDAIVLLTNEDRQHYSFLDPLKVDVIPNISSFAHEEKADLSNKRIVTAGRLATQKGYDILVEMAKDLREALPDWTIDIYGKGEMLPLLEEKIELYKLEDYVHINDPVKDIRGVFLQSSIYLMTSRNEGLPMVLIEAQTCGLPIVSFDCPEGPREIINDNHNGYLVQPGDTETMISRIVELASNQNLRRRFGNDAYETSKRYSEKEIVKRWEQLFSEIDSRITGDEA